MKDKLEFATRFIPALTLICYIFGFIIYNIHLGQFGIIDISIFNLKYIVSGLLYLLLVVLILVPLYIWRTSHKGGYSTLFLGLGYSCIVYSIYSLFLYPTNTNSSLVQLDFLHHSLLFLSFGEGIRVRRIKKVIMQEV